MDKMNYKDRLNKFNLRNLIWFSFTIITSIFIVVILLTFNFRFNNKFLDEVKKEQEIIIKQINTETTTYLKNIMRVSDTLSYSVIQGKEYDKADFLEKIQLIYDSNKDTIKNIALFDNNGEFLIGSPAVTLREDANVKNTDWFLKSQEEIENVHFSLPHVQNLFYDSINNYEWVVSVSRSVPIEINNETINGVLLMDISYRSLEQLYKNVSLRENSYIYLTDSNNEIVYHPRQQLINSGYIDEDLSNNDDNEFITKSTVGYTGWEIIGITTETTPINSIKNNLFFIFLVLLYIFIIIIVNSIVSKKISNPIMELESMVGEIEKGNMEVKSEIKGFYEVEHLGNSIESMAKRIKKLMVDIESEHEQKRLSEFNALQSQINPHFLYNTLEVIVWMIENEKPKEASKAVVALAKFFRISLSKGNSIICVSDEIEHVKNYMTIQSFRYKDRFKYNIFMDEDTKELSTIKLILQPIVENAIYHGLEYMDDGEINIYSYIENEDLILKVVDNGQGISEERLEMLKKGQVESKNMGSGIGIKNIDDRIKIYFGDEYGLTIESELDEGTEVIIKLPIINRDKQRY